MAAVSVFPSPGELGAALARSVAEAAAEAVASGGRFTLGLSGGSLVQLLARELPAALSAVAGSEPSRWLVAFCDERLVPPEHPESTGGAYREFPGEDPPRFELLLLGVGPDGHTASLFPGHALLQEQNSLISYLLDSPKPPPQRVTMTLPLLNAAKSVLVVATGASKAPVIQRILEQQEPDPVPAARLRPRSGRLRWLLDREAAAELREPPAP
ncbi:6-phosphogluconolactonase-like isoform X2 [Melospiza melodia melodia]|uniref:6-phosphogluconolactonase-like isoform X2 n=1 Tax=Melospiza melodia melodia TaxID=1914991 RepID=UPI002FD360AE